MSRLVPVTWSASAWEAFARSRRAGIALVVLCLTVYLPGFVAIPPVDRDEARFAQASRQMFEAVALPADERDEVMHSGGLAVPMLGTKTRLNKPPLIYWLQSASAAALTGGDPSRDAVWMYRVPSLLAAMMIVLLTWRLGSSMFDARVGFLGAALLAVCPVYMWEAHQARADMVLIVCTLIGQAGLWLAWRDRNDEASWSIACMVWFGLALGMLAKGPITPMVMGFTALAIGVTTGRWRWLLRTKPVVGVVLVALCVTPWVVLVGNHVGWDELLGVFRREVLERSTSAMEGHWGPPGYHVVLMVALFWPGSLLTGYAIGRAFSLGLPGGGGGSLLQRLRRRFVSNDTGDRAFVFCVAWVVPSWIVFELVGTKLPHYTMPLYPAVALLSASAVFAANGGVVASTTTGLARMGYVVWALVGVGISVAPLILVLTGRDGAVEQAMVVGVALLCVVLVAVSLIASLSARYLSAVVLSGVAIVFAGVSLLGVTIPGRWEAFPATAMRSHVEQAGWTLGDPIASVGYHEDSLVFATRGRVDRINADEIASWFGAHPDGRMWIGVAAKTDVTPVLEAHDLVLLGEMLGAVNYSRGETLDIFLVERVRE